MWKIHLVKSCIKGQVNKSLADLWVITTKVNRVPYFLRVISPLNNDVIGNDVISKAEIGAIGRKDQSSKMSSDDVVGHFDLCQFAAWAFRPWSTTVYRD